jgi:cell division protein FtsB
MNPRNKNLVLLLYAVLLSGFGIGGGSFFIEARLEYRALKDKEAAAQRSLEAARLRLKEQETYLERLRTDPVLVERVIRERGYGRPGEIVFRFDGGR